MRFILILIVALIWGIASLWWYTCKVKGFCSDGTFPSSTSLSHDSDGDEISDNIETKLGLDPNSTDSNKDGLSDAAEVGANLETPVDSDGDGTVDAVDTDGDGTPNYLDADSDNDGVSDAGGDGIDSKTEVGSDPNTTLDSDGDGTIDALGTEDNSAKEPEPAPEKPSDEVSVDVKAGDSSSGIQAANIYFPFRSTSPQFSAEAESYFSDVVNTLTANAEQKISLVGHTDNIGNDAANQQLGLERAKMIRSMLVQRGVSESQIGVASEGETNPIASNDTQVGRDKNRRVELLPK